MGTAEKEHAPLGHERLLDLAHKHALIAVFRHQLAQGVLVGRGADERWKQDILLHDLMVLVTEEPQKFQNRCCIENLDTLWFLDHCDGGNRPGKFERDIALLTEGLKAEPMNARYWYYLGQSYRDALRHQEAICAFSKRIEIGGWDEETFYAMLECARAAKRL